MPKTQKPSNYLIWIDLEMTGLNPAHDRILELATLVTDNALNIVAEGPTFTIHQNETLLSGMDEWNTKHHNASGLVERVRHSTTTEAHAEEATIAFLTHYLKPGESPLCGNSIHQDRIFLARYMPQLEKFCHYRNLDVSTVKELARRWAPTLSFKKKSAHRALDDIKESIAELKFYNEHFFKC
ncbi:MAG: oligoribonuclease [Gammaproteobacteria bacterium]|nr:oligoribonuclease [Gammaproteobacteria bacterium]